MVHHAELAHSMGLSPKHVLICEDGDQIEVNKTGIKRAGQVPAGFHYIDGSAGDLDERPLEERRMLAEFGVLQISAGVDKDHAKIIQPVRLTARGWFEANRTEPCSTRVTNEVRAALEWHFERARLTRTRSTRSPSARPAACSDRSTAASRYCSRPSSSSSPLFRFAVSALLRPTRQTPSR